MRIGIGALLVGVLGACGASTSSLVGTWIIADGGGSKTINCPGQGAATFPITGEVLIVQGSAGGITSSATIVANIDGISETFNVSNGSTATLVSGMNTFPLQSDAGTLETLTLTSDNIVTGNSSLSETASGTLAGGDGGACTFSRNISATQG
jgi:hypothetical protein